MVGALADAAAATKCAAAAPLRSLHARLTLAPRLIDCDAHHRGPRRLIAYYSGGPGRRAAGRPSSRAGSPECRPKRRPRRSATLPNCRQGPVRGQWRSRTGFWGDRCTCERCGGRLRLANQPAAAAFPIAISLIPLAPADPADADVTSATPPVAATFVSFEALIAHAPSTLGHCLACCGQQSS